MSKIDDLYAEWQRAREAKDYAKADAARDKLITEGFRPVVKWDRTTRLTVIAQKHKRPRACEGRAAAPGPDQVPGPESISGLVHPPLCDEMSRAIASEVITTGQVDSGVFYWIQMTYEVDDGDGYRDTMERSMAIRFCPFCGASLPSEIKE